MFFWFKNAGRKNSREQHWFQPLIEMLEDRTLLALDFLHAGFDVGASPNDVVVGDFNEDSVLDLAVANSGDGNVTVLLGNGDGSFGSRTDWSVGNSPSSVVANYFNADSHMDLVVANAMSNNLSVLLGNGDGTFESADNIPTNDSPTSLAVGDFNLDGNQDLAFADRGLEGFNSGGVSVLLGNGDGTFSPVDGLAVGGAPSFVTVADVNGDFAPDVIVANPLVGIEPCLTCLDDLADKVIVRLGLRDGTFLGEKTLDSAVPGGANARSVAVGDFDYDGRADLAVVDYVGSAASFDPLKGLIAILRTVKDESKVAGIALEFSEFVGVTDDPFTPTALVVADFSNSHNHDLAVTDIFDNSVKIFLSNGRFTSDTGFQKAQKVTVGERPVALAVADFNGDHRNDLVVVNKESNNVSVLIRAGLTFSDISASLPGVMGSTVWGDYDNDGDLDILLAGFPNRDWMQITRVYENEGGGTFSIKADLPGVGEGSAAWGDYDNDGDLDILLTGYEHMVPAPISRVYRNDDGAFVDISADLPGVGFSAAAWGDYDNDGDLDIVLTGLDDSPQNDDAQAISAVLENQGGTFVDILAGLPGVINGSVAWGDYDKDGDLDILLTGYDSADTSAPISRVYRNDGDDNFSDIADLPGVGFSAAAWGDYDNDGDLDILLTGFDPAPIARVYRNDGEDEFTDITAGLAGLGNSAAAWGDYDNDGDLDILLTGYYSADDLAPISRVYRNDGEDTFSDISDALPGIANAAVAWGDYDNDDDLDILISGGEILSASVDVFDGSFSFFVDAKSQIWQNEIETTNASPAAPTGLSATFAGPTSVTFSWEPSTDAQTTSAGLSYNLRVGTTPGGSDVVGPMASTSSGLRRIAREGFVQDTTWTLDGLLVPGESYYWSVQAIDTALAGSAFSAESEYVHDTDGVPPDVEKNAPNGGDGNADGTPDSQQANVASLVNQVTGTYVTIVSPPNTALFDVSTIDTPPGLPEGVDLPVGSFRYEVVDYRDVPDGRFAPTITYILHGGEYVNTFYKHGVEPYEFLKETTGPAGEEITTGAEFDGNLIRLYLVDGERGDDDRTANGVIVDPGSPAEVNVPPVITVEAGTVTVDEGQTAAMTGAVSDPNPGDTITLSASVGTAIDVGDGTWYWSFVTGDGPAQSQTVTIIATDQDGAESSTQFELAVNNVAPLLVSSTITATKSNKANVGDLVLLSANFSDMGTLDTHEVRIDWGDGTSTDSSVSLADFLSFHGSGGGYASFTAVHVYSTGGIFTVSFTGTDDDGGMATGVTQAWVTGVRLTDDGELQIVGTSQPDQVSINQQGNCTLKVHADFLPGRFESFVAADVNKIIAYLFEGDDRMSIAGNVRIPAILHGGDDNDYLFGGGGPSVLLGDAGNDTLAGGPLSRNVLIGGLGADRLLGGSDEDLLIGGSTSYDADDAALMDLLDEWNDAADYTVRVAQLRTGTGASGIQLAAGVTVFDDTDTDVLTGAADRDWFFFNDLDDVTGLRDNEETN